MRAVLKSTDPVHLSFVCAVLKDAGIDAVVLDEHTSILEGSIGILPRRIMVADDDADEALALIKDIRAAPPADQEPGAS